MADIKPKNLVLSRLSSRDYNLLAPNLRYVDLPLRKMLERPGQPITTIYFPESGIVSVVGDGGKKPIEVGIIGREGITGLAVVLGGDRSSQETFIQVPGVGTGHVIYVRRLTRVPHCIAASLCSRFPRAIDAYVARRRAGKNRGASRAMAVDGERSS